MRLAENSAVREAVNVSSISGASFREAMGMTRSERHAFLRIYQEQNPPIEIPNGDDD